MWTPPRGKNGGGGAGDSVSRSGGGDGGGGSIGIGGNAPADAAAAAADNNADEDSTILDRLVFRTVTPTDVSRCYEIERASYPPDEAATKSSLQYRQHHAAPFFRCAVLLPPEVLQPMGGGGGGGGGGGFDVGGAGSGGETGGGGGGVKGRNLATDSLILSGTVIGYVCSTRCWEFDHEAMSVHDPTGPLLAVHSVVVLEKYRRKGVGGKMLKEYVSAVRKMELKIPLEKIVLLSKAENLAFYVRAGFKITRPSPIVHGSGSWYDGELEVRRRRGGAAVRRPSDSAVIKGGAGTGGSGGASGGGSGGGGDDDPGDDGQPCWIVDSFAVAGVPGSGNPAGVVLLPETTDASRPEVVAWMRIVAKEFNQAETAFLWETPDEGADGGGNTGGSGSGSGASSISSGGSGGALESDEVRYRIKYFTCSGAEVDLCGHATLASASVLFDLLGSGAGGKKKRGVRKIIFHANKDVLLARLRPDASTGVQIEPTGCDGQNDGRDGSSRSVRIAMDFPWRSVREMLEEADRTAALSMLQKAFALTNEAIEQGVLFVGIDSVGEDLLVELTRDCLLGLGYGPCRINYDALAAWGGGFTRGVILCCRASEEDNIITSSTGEATRVDFLSRFFGPKAGIPEDPVTGSAHCTLAPYFGAKIGRANLVGRQISERGGMVECSLLDGAGEGEGRPRKVRVVGTAVLAVGGTLYV